MAALSEGRSLEKRQTQSGDRFFLFGQVMRSLGEYKSTTMVLYSPIGRIIEIMYHFSGRMIYISISLEGDKKRRREESR